ncbi:MAG: Cyclic nucleotide-binding protein, partial [Deltaproteobacteria bacterium]|nr:Cyclic nucleotide-binding protein [Deltaproteobacteria bacterium]
MPVQSKIYCLIAIRSYTHLQKVNSFHPDTHYAIFTQMQTKAKQKRSNLIKPLYIALLLYLIAGAIETGILFAKANDIASPAFINVGKKAIIFFSTLSTVILLRWIVSDAPFNFLRRHTVTPM